MVNSIVKDDNHEEDIQIILKKLEGLKRTGVLHLGAHKGEEVNYYLNFGYEHIALIEAQPTLYDALKSKFKLTDNINVLNYAICDKVGQIDFHIIESNSGTESSSILKMEKLDEIVSSLKTSETLSVPSITIDQLILKQQIDIRKYNILVSDIQGADYMALKGAENTIRNFDAVVVEVQCISLYENFVSEEKMDSLMKRYGFYKDFVIYHELYTGDHRFPAWGEAVYFNQKLG